MGFVSNPPKASGFGANGNDVGFAYITGWTQATNSNIAILRTASTTIARTPSWMAWTNLGGAYAIYQTTPVTTRWVEVTVVWDIASPAGGDSGLSIAQTGAGSGALVTSQLTLHQQLIGVASTFTYQVISTFLIKSTDTSAVAQPQILLTSSNSFNYTIGAWVWAKLVSLA